MESQKSHSACWGEEEKSGQEKGKRKWNKFHSSSLCLDKLQVHLSFNLIGRFERESEREEVQQGTQVSHWEEAARPGQNQCLWRLHQDKHTGSEDTRRPWEATVKVMQMNKIKVTMNVLTLPTSVGVIKSAIALAMTPRDEIIISPPSQRQAKCSSTWYPFDARQYRQKTMRLARASSKQSACDECEKNKINVTNEQEICTRETLTHKCYTIWEDVEWVESMRRSTEHE